MAPARPAARLKDTGGEASEAASIRPVKVMLAPPAALVSTVVVARARSTGPATATGPLPVVVRLAPRLTRVAPVSDTPPTPVAMSGSLIVAFKPPLWLIESACQEPGWSPLL